MASATHSATHKTTRKKSLDLSHPRTHSPLPRPSHDDHRSSQAHRPTKPLPPSFLGQPPSGKLPTKKRTLSAAAALSPRTPKQLRRPVQPSSLNILPKKTASPFATHTPTITPATDGTMLLTRCHQCRCVLMDSELIVCQNNHSSKMRGGRKFAPSTSSAPDPSSVHLALTSTGENPCLNRFCGKCMMLRYGEDVTKVRANVNPWMCPVCLDYCNCSVCRKKKGLPPTGRLDQTVLNAGFNSAKQFLELHTLAQGADMITMASRKRERGSAGDTHDDSQSNPPNIAKKAKEVKEGQKAQEVKKVRKANTVPSKGSVLGLKAKAHPAKKSVKRVGPLKPVTTQTNNKSHKKQKVQNVKKADGTLVKKKTGPKHPKPRNSTKRPEGGIKGFKKKNNSRSNRPSAGKHQDKDKDNTKTTNEVASGPKIPKKRGPAVVLPPPIRYFPTGYLTSPQIQLRLHVREFVCRFRRYLPGLGGAMSEGSTSSLNPTRSYLNHVKCSETQRAEKVIDSMDDVVNFWVDDEGGMRAIVAGLVRLIESEVLAASHSDSSSDSASYEDGDDDDQEDEDEDEDGERLSKAIVRSKGGMVVLEQMKKEFKTSFTTSYSPFVASSVHSWQVALEFVEKECPDSKLAEIPSSPYLSLLSSAEGLGGEGGGRPGDLVDERLKRVRFSPEKKLAVVGGLIDVALRGQMLGRELFQGIEREKQARADWNREKAKLNKQLAELKAEERAIMGACLKSTTTKAVGEDGGEKMGGGVVEQRPEGLAKCEADVQAIEEDLKRLNGKISSVSSMNRLRFEPIGADIKGNLYYILTCTPGRCYPTDPTELSYAWSYSVVLYGRCPVASPASSGSIHELGKLANGVQVKKNHHKKKPQQVLMNGNTKSAKAGGSGSTVVTAPAQADGRVEEKMDVEEEEERAIETALSSQRNPNDQWMRVSKPGQILQLAAWIEYEAKRADFLLEAQQPGGRASAAAGKATAGGAGKIPATASGAGMVAAENTSSSTTAASGVGKSLKTVGPLVEQLQGFAELVEVRIKERDQLQQQRQLRSTTTGGFGSPMAAGAMVLRGERRR